MKPLKRPMFRSGGPINEGIMDGMKQPQQLVQPNEDGSRPGYAGPLAAIPLIFQGLRAARTLAPIAKNASIQLMLPEVHENFVKLLELYGVFNSNIISTSIVRFQ